MYLIRMVIMKEKAIKAILGSLLMAFALPSYAFANVSRPISFSRLNSEKFNGLGTVEIARRYLSTQYASARLYNSQPQILGIAREYSQGQKVRWDYVSVESINNQEIKLNVNGKIMIRRKPPIRVGLFLRRNSQGRFTIINYDYSTGRRCRVVCKNKVRGALRNLPSHFPRFQQVLNRILA